MGSTL